MTKFLGPAHRQKLRMKVYYAKLKYRTLLFKGHKNLNTKLNDSYKWVRSINPKSLFIRTVGMKYYVWHSATKKTRTLDNSGKDQSLFDDMVLVKTFRARSWKTAQDKFHKMGETNIESALDKFHEIRAKEDTK